MILPIFILWIYIILWIWNSCVLELAKLLPVYTKLADLWKAELDSENQRTWNQTLMDKARRDLDMLQLDASFDDYDDFDFVSSWTEEETKNLLTAVMPWTALPCLLAVA